MDKDQFLYYKLSVLTGSVFLIMSLFVNFYAGVLAASWRSNYVTDIVLSNTRPLDLDGVFIYASWLLLIFAIVVFARKWQKVPFALKSVSLFILIRSVFINLTHVGPFPNAISVDPNSLLVFFVFGNGFFFSGHTGLPFLLALIFWEEKKLRSVFLATSVFFGIVVLLAHLHYTIDVFSAFFISYGIFRISQRLFSKDLALARSRDFT